MSSMDDTCFDFNDMGPDNVFRNDLPISGYSPVPEHNPLFDFDSFELHDDPFFKEDDEAVIGLKSSYKSMDGSYSPSSCTSDDVPATPLSNAESVSYALLAELEMDQTITDPACTNPKSSELKSMLQEGLAVCHSPKEQLRNIALVEPTCHADESSNLPKPASTTASREEQPRQKMIISGIDMKSPPPLPSSRPTTVTVVAADESSIVRQNKNNLLVAGKSDVVKVGVKRKTIQVKEGAKKLKQNSEDSAPISRNEKNAIAARENRLKKKMELEELKKNEALLDNENQCLRKENSDHLKTIQMLKQEVAYYKSVLFNQSSLATLLHSLNPMPKLKLSSSAGVSSADEVVGAESMSGGVCLHVNGADASLEMCSICSLKAQASLSS